MSVFLSLSQPEHAFQRITKSESIMHVGNVAVFSASSTETPNCGFQAGRAMRFEHHVRLHVGSSVAAGAGGWMSAALQKRFIPRNDFPT